MTIGRVAGVAIRVHRSWIVIALLIAWSLYSRYALGDHGVVVTASMAAVGTVLFFASVLVHELAHSLEAQHRGVEVSGITLFLFGGATETSFDVQRPLDEFALTAVGPFSSLVLGGGFGILAHYTTIAGFEAVGMVAGTLGWVNVALAIFNLLPGAPLDGGRILRSVVWAVTDDRARAVRVASRAGQALGYLLAGLGLLQLFLVPGALVGGLWLAFIGWFLAQAAQAELTQQRVTDALAGMTIGELVGPGPLPEVQADATLAHAADELRRQPEDVLAVRDGTRILGILPLDTVADVHPNRRGTRHVRDVATPLDELRTAPPDTEIGDVLRSVGGRRPLVVTVSDGAGDISGIVTPERLSRVVERALRLGHRPRIEDAAPDHHIPGGEGP